VTATRGCIDTICLSWWWARCARNMYRVKNINKYAKKKIVRHVGHVPRLVICWFKDGLSEYSAKSVTFSHILLLVFSQWIIIITITLISHCLELQTTRGRRHRHHAVFVSILTLVQYIDHTLGY